jgi:hypothetical protein
MQNFKSHGFDREAEAVACLEGAQLALERIKRPIVIEADCNELVKALNSTDIMWARWAGIIAEIRKDSNLVADGLAKLAGRGEQDMIMQFSVPTGILALIHRDRNFVTSCNASTS